MPRSYTKSKRADQDIKQLIKRSIAEFEIAERFPISSEWGGVKITYNQNDRQIKQAIADCQLVCIAPEFCFESKNTILRNWLQL